MEKYTGKVAIVTGASAGIGAAIVKLLLHHGMKVVGLARRKEKIEELGKLLGPSKKNLYALKVDMTNDKEIVEAFKWVTDNIGPVTVLVNNAGVFKPGNIIEGDPKDWKTIMDTNLMGVAIGCQEAVKIMKAHQVTDGYIININSIAGHNILKIAEFPLSFYSASKHALTCLGHYLRQELLSQGVKIRTSSISPGFVDTEIMLKSGISENDYEAIKKKMPYLLSEDIADAVNYLLSSPSRVEVPELTIIPAGQQT